MKKTSLILFQIVLTSMALTTGAMAHAFVNGPNTNRVEIDMSPDERESLFRSSKTKVPQAAIRLFESGILSQENEIALSTRGQTSLKKYPRKNLSINVLKDSTGRGLRPMKIGKISGKDLIFSASPEDQLVTKNMIVYRLLKAAQITALETDYAEVVLNGKSQGLHMISKSPDSYLLEDKKAIVVFRRRYNDVIELKKAKKSLTEQEITEYQNTLTQIHHQLTELKGETLFLALSENLNLEKYMRWLALNFIVGNGDFADEVFFFGTKKPNGQIYFEATPWDLDDTFSEKMHLQSIPGMPNFRKTERSKKQLLFGYESRLDQAISRDPFLMAKYFQVVEQVATEITDEKVDQVISKVQTLLTPYLNDQDILENGRLDASKKVHSPEAVLRDLHKKADFLKARLSIIKQELDAIHSEGAGGTNRAEKISPASLQYLVW